MNAGKMPTGGGLEFVGRPGASYVMCPLRHCSFRVEVTDLGQFVDTGVTENQLRTHAESHSPQDYLRTIVADRGEIERLRSTLAKVGVCSWCDRTYGLCEALWPAGRKCCPDCEHRGIPDAEVVSVRARR